MLTQVVNNLSVRRETQVLSLGQEDTLEKGKATHCSILAWRIARTEKPGRLQSMGSQRVGYDFMGNRWGNSGNSVRLYFWGLQNHCRW